MAPQHFSARKLVLQGYFPLLIVFTIFAGLNQQKYPEMIFSSDQEGYYMYIAAPFFSGGFANYKSSSNLFTPYPGTDKVFTKYSYGTALLEAPFVVVAHFIYLISEGHHDSHGRLPIHGLGVLSAFIFYSLLSLWLLRRFLEQKFDPIWVMVALCGLYLGTNWIFYTVREPGNSHVVSLFVLCCWLVFIPKLFREPSAQNFAIAGLLFGLTSLIRPTNAVAILYLLFAEYQAPNGGTFKERWQFLIKNWKFIPLFAGCTVLVWLPQMTYWHYATGHWFFYSYQNEGFINWRSPKILHVLFDVQNGLFVYAPILFLPLCGLLVGAWRKQREAIGTLFILSLLTYLFASWWTWSFGGAYGHRCYVDWMGFLALPFCWFLQYIAAPSQRLRRMVVGLIPCFIYLSLGLGYLYQWPWEHPDWTWLKLFQTIGRLLPC